MTEFAMDRLRENLESLKMKNTLEILDVSDKQFKCLLDEAFLDKIVRSVFCS